MAGGIAMSQVEVVRPRDMGVSDDAVHAFYTPEVSTLIANGNTDAVRMRIAKHMGDGHFGNLGLDEDLTMIQDQFRRWSEEKVVPFAHGWHERDELIPMEILQEMAELGVFGLTIPEEYGGLGMGKMAMCVVTEELSRAYIGVGSLGTRSEIAAELIRLGGTEDQKQHYLPLLASANCCRRPSSPSPIPAPTWGRCAPGRSWMATSTRSSATRPGSPTRRAPT
jgi:(2S)-methylsuccinyl-CoA dehydrogenase